MKKKGNQTIFERIVMKTPSLSRLAGLYMAGMALCLVGCGPSEPNNDFRTSMADSTVSLEIEGKVVSLNRTENLEEYDGGSFFPEDSGLIMIESVGQIVNEVALDLEPYEEGKEVFVTFSFGTRPAQVRRVAGGVTYGRELSVACSLERSFFFENGIPIYSRNDCNLRQDIIVDLPGLEVGQIFQATLNIRPQWSDPVSIGLYE